MEAVTHLLAVLVWPAVVLVALFLLRRELGGLFGRAREIEGPGWKVILDEIKVKQIVQEAQQQGDSAAAIAHRIVNSATVLDRREARILRALFDDEGRAIYNYQTQYYRPALDALLAKGHIRRLTRGFALTEEGRRVTGEYLLGVIQRSVKDETEA